MTGGARCFSFEAAAARDMNLEFDKINSGRAFGYRVFDLEPGVHLHEREGLARGLVQELHRTGVAVGRRLAQAYRCLTQHLILLGGKRWGGSFFEDFLVAALNRAVAHPCGPRFSVLIGDDLDFDVARVLQQSLHENSGVAEGLEGFGARALKSLRELTRRTYPPNPVAAAPGRSFNKEWIAQALGVMLGVG
jgi:hypothetical protein